MASIIKEDPMKKDLTQSETKQPHDDGNLSSSLSSKSSSSSTALPKFTKKSEEDAQLIRLALHRSSLFTCLDEEQIQRFIDTAELRTYDPGEIVVLQGSVDDEDSEICITFPFIKLGSLPGCR